MNEFALAGLAARYNVLRERGKRELAADVNEFALAGLAARNHVLRERGECKLAADTNEFVLVDIFCFLKFSTFYCEL